MKRLLIISTILAAISNHATAATSLPDTIELIDSHSSLSWLDMRCKEVDGVATCAMIFRHIWRDGLEPSETLVEYYKKVGEEIDYRYRSVFEDPKMFCEVLPTMKRRLAKEPPAFGRPMPTLMTHFNTLNSHCDRADFFGFAEALKRIYPKASDMLPDMVTMEATLDRIRYETCVFTAEIDHVTLDRASDAQWRKQVRGLEHLLTHDTTKNTWTYEIRTVRSNDAPATSKGWRSTWLTPKAEENIQAIECKNLRRRELL